MNILVHLNESRVLSLLEHTSPKKLDMNIEEEYRMMNVSANKLDDIAFKMVKINH